jgi:chaperone modulatory protein CbpM
MEQEDLIPAKEFCLHHQIEYSFISSLNESGLIRITSVKKSSYIHPDEILKLEKFVRFHYDLDINIQGIETINHLLEKIEDMQRQIVSLRNKMEPV